MPRLAELGLSLGCCDSCSTDACGPWYGLIHCRGTRSSLDACTGDKIADYEPYIRPLVPAGAQNLYKASRAILLLSHLQPCL